MILFFAVSESVAGFRVNSDHCSESRKSDEIVDFVQLTSTNLLKTEKKEVEKQATIVLIQQAARRFRLGGANHFAPGPLLRVSRNAGFVTKRSSEPWSAALWP